MQRLRAALAAALVLALVGCGGSPRKDIESIRSIATEGALLARQSSRGDATRIFVRVHARYLEQEADRLTRSLVAARRPREARVAAAVVRDLELLRRGSDVAADLDRLAKRAEGLAG